MNIDLVHSIPKSENYDMGFHEHIEKLMFCNWINVMRSF